MHSPPQEELEQLFQQVRPGWRAEAKLLGTMDPNRYDWMVELFNERGDYAGYARLSFEDKPPRLEFKTLDLMPVNREQGIFTALYPLLGPWLQRYGFEWIVIRDWLDPDPFLNRGFIFRDDPSGFDQTRQVLTIDLRDPDRPSRTWVDDPIKANPPEPDPVVPLPGPPPTL